MARAATRSYPVTVSAAVLAAVGVIGLGAGVVNARAEGAPGDVLRTLLPSPGAIERFVASLTEPAPDFDASPVWAFDGADVDGDGAGDFVNPTGGAPRDHDDFGSGAFGASRDGGRRMHMGVDYAGEAGQEVLAPVSGYVTKVGKAYGGTSDLQFVEITNPALGYVARVFYVEPTVAVGDVVALGRPVGTLTSLQGRYDGITDHVHLEMTRQGHRVDPGAVILARREDPNGGGSGFVQTRAAAQ